MDEAALLTLTERAYDAAAGAETWHGAGEALARLVGARSVSLMAGEAAAPELLCHNGIPAEAVALYHGRYRPLDLWTSRAAEALRRAPGAGPRVWTSGTLVPDREFLRSEFYGGFGRGYGLRWVVGTVVPLGAAGIMPVGLHRREGDEPFGTGEAALLARALPHLRRALQVRHRLAGAAAAASAALMALPDAVLVADAGLSVLLANPAAEAMAARGAGIRLARVPGAWAGPVLLGAARRDDADALAAAVRTAALGLSPGAAVRLGDTAGRPAAAALVSPLPGRLLDPACGRPGPVPGRALVLLRGLAPAAPPPAPVLRALFGLTAAEAEVARALVGGATKTAVAARRGASAETVGTQVRSILAKSGARSLRDLEGLLARLAPR